MQKNELISLINEMHKELLSNVTNEPNASIEQVFNYLLESAEIIKNVNESTDDVHASGYAEALFHNAYKDIAEKSLASYADTNANIEKLTMLHEETLNECHETHIDLPTLTSKFNEIQSHMTQEVQKANSIISQLTEQVKALEEKSNLDALTKVFNRRALSTYLENVCSTKELPYSFHMLILDIDDFKNINDTYGHVAGDKVLIFIANILRKTLRDGDKVFRYGGEEFIIILNRIDDELCLKITNRLLNLIRKNKLIYKGQNLNVTMSIGTTKYKDADTPDSLIARADSALYKAKKNGKNQIYSEV
jgi:diguanylate cyclase (GGDEF)-like protein